MSSASIVTSFWENLGEHNEQAFFLVLVGFVGSFAFIRMSTRIIRSDSVSWWPGNIESAGLHLHHLVFGIVTMMVAGTLGFLSSGVSPYTEITAVFFGVGLGLTIDEFALWVHLEDVYWSREGRSSIDATVIAAALMSLVLLGVSPATIESGSAGAVIGSVLGLLAIFGCVAICFAKGRILHGAVGIFVAPIAIYGAGRIGKPDSPWARRRYGERSAGKQAKAEARFNPGRRTERFKESFRDLVGGKPTEIADPADDPALAATMEASGDVRVRAEQQAREATRGPDGNE